jgi:hypothetical protein
MAKKNKKAVTLVTGYGDVNGWSSHRLVTLLCQFVDDENLVDELEEFLECKAEAEEECKAEEERDIIEEEERPDDDDFDDEDEENEELDDDDEFSDDDE